MAPHAFGRRPQLGTERVREHLLTALHTSRLGPGDRIVSVRRLATMTGMNRKTVHRAYRELVREGLLESRPGSGTFVAEPGAANGERRAARDLLRSANRCRAEAATLGLSPEVFAGFLANYLGTGLHGLPVAVVECNLEQIGLIGEDLAAGIGVKPRPALLADLKRAPRETIAGAWGVLTTDCHRQEVEEAVSPLGLPVYCVSLDQEFPRRILREARKSQVVMVVRDAGFAPVFQRLLAQLGGGDVLERIRIVVVKDLRAALREAGDDVAVCLCPLVEDEVAGRLPAHVERIEARWRVPWEAVDRVRVAMACDLALGRGSAARPGIRKSGGGEA